MKSIILFSLFFVQAAWCCSDTELSITQMSILKKCIQSRCDEESREMYWLAISIQYDYKNGITNQHVNGRIMEVKNDKWIDRGLIRKAKPDLLQRIKESSCKAPQCATDKCGRPVLAILIKSSDH